MPRHRETMLGALFRRIRTEMGKSFKQMETDYGGTQWYPESDKPITLTEHIFKAYECGATTPTELRINFMDEKHFFDHAERIINDDGKPMFTNVKETFLTYAELDRQQRRRERLRATAALNCGQFAQEVAGGSEQADPKQVREPEKDLTYSAERKDTPVRNRDGSSLQSLEPPRSSPCPEHLVEEPEQLTVGPASWYDTPPAELHLLTPLARNNDSDGWCCLTDRDELRGAECFLIEAYIELGITCSPIVIAHFDLSPSRFGDMLALLLSSDPHEVGWYEVRSGKWSCVAPVRVFPSPSTLSVHVYVAPDGVASLVNGEYSTVKASTPVAPRVAWARSRNGTTPQSDRPRGRWAFGD